MISPIVFKLYNKQDTAEEVLIRGGQFWLEPNGKSALIALGTASEVQDDTRADLVISLKQGESQKSNNNRYDWGITIAGVNGAGLIESSDEFMFKAPKSGYKPQYSYAFKADDRGEWTRSIEKKYYVRSGDGKHARIEIYFEPGGEKPWGSIDYYINPTGSKNLTAQPRRRGYPYDLKSAREVESPPKIVSRSEPPRSSWPKPDSIKIAEGLLVRCNHFNVTEEPARITLSTADKSVADVSTDISISMTRGEGQKNGKYDWNVTIAAVNGAGLVERKDKVMSEAPENGYESQYHYGIKADEPKWSNCIYKQYYVRSGDGKKHARIVVFFNSQVEKNEVFMKFLINPTGSRDLTLQPDVFMPMASSRDLKPAREAYADMLNALQKWER